MFHFLKDPFSQHRLLHLSTGLELSFYSGVYGTCIGATEQFGESAKGLIGISGIVVGIGEIIGIFTVFLLKIHKLTNMKYLYKHNASQTDRQCIIMILPSLE